MGIITCAECGDVVADQSKDCPKCGMPQQLKPVVSIEKEKELSIPESESLKKSKAGFMAGFFGGTLSILAAGFLISQGAPWFVLVGAVMGMVIYINSIKSFLGALTGIFLCLFLGIFLLVNLVSTS